MKMKKKKMKKKKIIKKINILLKEVIIDLIFIRIIQKLKEKAKEVKIQKNSN